MDCDHTPCACGDTSEERNGKNYCSSTCADAHSGNEIDSCSCGHPACPLD